MKKGAVITIGTFDGVHKGHQDLLRRVVLHAKKKGYHSAALVFTYPPKHILNPSHEPQQLTLWHEKKKYIRELGIEKIIPLAFTRALASLSAKQFFTRMVKKYQVKEAVIGFNFAFGKERQAHAENLRVLGARFGIPVTIIPPRKYMREIISSSSIRAALKQGFFAKAFRMLGHHYQIAGTVIRGCGWGSRHDIPTANLHVSQKKLMPRGVFIALLETGGKTYPAVASIGFRPTLHPVKKLLPEVHVLHRTLSLYQRQVRLILLKKIRNEQHFRTTQSLLKQIHQDIRHAEIYFKVGRTIANKILDKLYVITYNIVGRNYGISKKLNCL